MDIKEQQLRVRLTDMGHFAFADIKELTGKSVSEICREIMEAGLLCLMRSDGEHPLSNTLLKPSSIEQRLHLYAEFMSAKHNAKGYGFRQIKEAGETRYLITPPPVAKAKDYWRGITEMLTARGLSKADVAKAIEPLKKKMQRFADEKNRTRRASLREKNPEKAKAADEIIRAAEQAEKTEREK